MSSTQPAAAAGTFALGDLIVNRMGLGSMRLTVRADVERREAGPVAEHAPEVSAVARRHGASEQQVRLAWTLHQGAHVLAIPGTGSVDHLDENVAAAALRLDERDLALLAGARDARAT